MGSYSVSHGKTLAYVFLLMVNNRYWELMRRMILTIVMISGWICLFAQIPEKKYEVINYSIDNGFPSVYYLPLSTDSTQYQIISSNRIYRFDGSNYIDFCPNEDVNKIDFGKVYTLDASNYIITNNSHSIKYNSRDNTIDTIIHLFNSPLQLNLSTTYKDLIVYFESNKFYFIKDTGKEYNLDKEIKVGFQFSGTVTNIFTIANMIYIPKAYYSNSFITINLDTYEVIEYNNKNTFYHMGAYKDLLLFLGKESLDIYNQELTLVHSVEIPKEFQDARRRYLLGCKENQYYVSFWNKLLVLNLESYSWEYIIKDQEGKDFHENDFFSDLSFDDSGNLFFKSNFNGTYRINTNTLNFDFYSANDYNIKEILLDEESNRIIGASIDGQLFSLDLTDGHFTPIPQKSIEEFISFITKVDKDQYLVCKPFSCELFSLHNTISSSTIYKNEWISGFFTHTISENATQTVVSAENYLYKINKQEPYDIEIEEIGVNFNVGTYLHNGKYYSGYQVITDIFELGMDYKVTRKIENPDSGPPKTMLSINDSTLWIGTLTGLFSLNTNTYEYTRVGNIYDCIYSIIPTVDGSYFCGTNLGIIEIDDNTIIKRYQKEDGIGANEFNTNAFQVSNQGRIYMGNSEGIVSFLPEEIEPEEFNLIRNITPISINNQRKEWLGKNNGLKLREHENNISFKVSTIGRKPSDSYNVQYHIPGYTESWVDAGKGNSIILSFSPGKYKVYYTSNTLFDKDLPLGEYFEVDVPQVWYQSLWFYLMILGTILGSIFYSIFTYNRNKIKVKMKELEAKEQLHYERNRISRELHDNIGLQLGMIGRNADWLNDNIEELEPEIVKERIDFLSDISSEINQNLRDTIWASKKDMYSSEDLISRTKTFIHKIQGSYPQIMLSVDTSTSPEFYLKPAPSLHLFRIIQESIQNAIKHAEAKSITVTFSQNEHKDMEVIIKDDGKGFQVEKESNGNGLDNILHRSKESKFITHINSIPDVGTKITILIKKAIQNEK